MRRSVCLGKCSLMVVMLLGMAFGGMEQLIAETLALDFTGGSTFETGNSTTLGWRFDVLSGIDVVALGYWDEGSDGLIESHPVGLWTDSGTLLASTVVDNTSSAIASSEVSGRWLFESIPLLFLSPGLYVVGGQINPSFSFPHDPVRAGTDTPITTPEVAFDVALSGTSSTLGLNFPNNQQAPGFNSYFGPNFLIGEPIPEPSTFVLFLTGILGVSGYGYWRRKSV